MLTKIQARVVAFFSRPAVQSTIRHAVTAGIAAGITLFTVGGWPALLSGVGAVVVLRAVWAVLRPAVVTEVIQVVNGSAVADVGVQTAEAPVQAAADALAAGGAGNPQVMP
jgi:hypothetical protein